jgi:hypothetical protein
MHAATRQAGSQPTGTPCGADKFTGSLQLLYVPKTSSTSCDQAVFVDQATDASVFPDAVVAEIDRPG